MTYRLIETPDYLGLENPEEKKPPFYIDFLSKKMRYRIKQASLRKELLARAIGFKPQDHPKIIDATAGLGRDSLILAALGFEIIMLERSDLLYRLLQDALKRAQQDADMANITARLSLVHADACVWLTQRHENKPDVIYLDPMFPERKKSAQVKREMQLLQCLLGNDDEGHTLLQTAISCAASRIVVKRPRLAPYLAALAPQFQIMGKTSRFDIYLARK